MKCQNHSKTTGFVIASVFFSFISLLTLSACRNGSVKDKYAEVQDTDEAKVIFEDDGDVQSLDSITGKKCVSEDGRITIETGIVPDGGTSPTYWTRWTIVNDRGEKHVLTNHDSPYQDEVHAITKEDGTVYYLVWCYSKASSSDGYEWLQAYRIKGNEAYEVDAIDGENRKGKTDFMVNYDIPYWYYATHGAGYDWILEYDAATRSLYVPLTSTGNDITDRYVVWHFNGKTFVNQGERPNKHLHPSLATYNRLMAYYTTKDYILRIDSLFGKGLRYASWKRPKTMADRPDAIIEGGKKRHHEVPTDRIQPCDDYYFRKGDYEYIVNYCETEPSDDGIGGIHQDFLLIKQHGKVVLKQEIGL